MKCIIAQGLTTVVNLQNKQNLLMRTKNANNKKTIFSVDML